MAGVILGFQFSKVEWSKKRCECGQILDIRTYES
jgi:hypothetical protein